MALFERKTISSIAELIHVLHEVMPAPAPVAPGAPPPAPAGGAGAPPLAPVPPVGTGGIRWFRGHGDATWKLLPALGRPPAHIDKELALTKRFKQDAYSLLHPPPANDWQWLFIMQHHGVPTRLLDWTENPLVALYFAVEKEKHYEKDGDLWCLDPTSLNTAAHVQPTVNGELPFFGIDTDLDPYNTEGLLKPRKLPPIAALAPRFFPRLAAQAGVFTMTSKEQTAIEDLDDGRHVGRISIPFAAKPALRRDLAALGIRRLTLFPELDAVAEHAKAVLT